MIFRVPQDIEQTVVYLVYAIIAVIIFLWGRAIGVNQTTEDYKIADSNAEVLGLRQKNQQLKVRNEELVRKNKFYLGIFSTIRHNIKKGE